MNMNRFLLVICGLLFTTLSFANNPQLEEEIKAIIKGKKAIIGASIIYDGIETTTINNQYRYPTMSVYKFHQALAVLNHLDKNKLSLDTKILVTKADLLPNTYSPLRDKNPAGNYEMTIAELIKYSVSESDNNACDILFKYIGGPKVVNDYIESLGIKETFISATEAKMGEAIENNFLNWTNIRSSAELLDLFLKKDLFATPYKKFLEKALVEATTGPNKLKGLLPENVVVGHKTGRTDRSEYGIQIAENDLGFVKLPNGKQYVIAVFVMNSVEDDETNSAVIAQISKAVFDYYEYR